MNTVGFNNFEAIRQQAQMRNNMAPRETNAQSGGDWRTILEAKRKEQNLDKKMPQVDLETIRKNNIEKLEAPSVTTMIKSVGAIANNYISSSIQANNVDLDTEPNRPTKRNLGNYVDMMA
ncbi:MAG: hypothetical protein OCC49_02300 [Fibrobacterales bacterium]